MGTGSKYIRYWDSDPERRRTKDEFVNADVMGVGG